MVNDGGVCGGPEGPWDSMPELCNSRESLQRTNPLTRTLSRTHTHTHACTARRGQIRAKADGPLPPPATPPADRLRTREESAFIARSQGIGRGLPSTATGVKGGTCRVTHGGPGGSGKAGRGQRPVRRGRTGVGGRPAAGGAAGQSCAPLSRSRLVAIGQSARAHCSIVPPSSLPVWCWWDEGGAHRGRDHGCDG